MNHRLLPILLLALSSAAHAETLTIAPYIQPGPTPTLVNNTDSKVLLWVADQSTGPGNDKDWSVQFFPASGIPSDKPASIAPARTITPTSTHAQITLLSTKPKIDDKYDTEARKSLPKQVDWKFYRAQLDNLPPNSVIRYTVLHNGKPVADASFPTRKTPDQPLDFAVFGDSGSGTPQQKQIAFHAFQSHPELIINVGDNVYSNGRASEYLTKFFPIYNLDNPSPTAGVPLLRSTPYYVAIGNHDVAQPNLDDVPDAMAFYYFFDLPANGLDAPFKYTPKLAGSKEKQAAFKSLAGDRFPKLDNYSFDNGPAHFLILDANKYINVTDKTFLDWIEKDLASSTAPWKFVFYHQPGFTAARHHFEEQRMRALTPLFEKYHVDIAFSGHVHNYQRTQPFFFKPQLDNGKIHIMPDGHIPGDFTIDTAFDGKTNTSPKGVIYIVSGGGGANLHSKDAVGDIPDAPENPTSAPAPEKPAETKPAKPDPAANIPDDISDHIAAFVADRWSFTSIHLEPHKLTLTQTDNEGHPFDSITITK